MRKWVVTAIILVLLAIVAGTVFRYQLKEMITGGEAKALENAQRLIDEGRPVSALNWLRPFAREMRETGAKAERWRQLYLTAALNAKDGAALVEIYEGYPKALQGNEEAQLLVADRLIKTNRPSDYARLREQWKGVETKPEVWFDLDADQMLLQGDRSGAIVHLNSHSFTGKADTGRLVRLALLTVKDQPRQAWEYLAQAHQKDPQNPEILSYRARLLEVVGQTGLALNEYLSAAEAAPEQAFYQDQLAEFYRRHDRYDLAVDAWKTQLEKGESDVIWLKAWFWTRVIVPRDIAFDAQKLPKGSLEPFLKYLVALPKGKFWDAEAFAKLPNNQTYLQTQQVTFWLRLLDALQRHNEDLAWELLQYNFFSPQSWNPGLENLLRKVLTYRKIGTFNIDVVNADANAALVKPANGDKKVEHPMVTEVNALSVKGADVLKISPELRELLTSPLAVPASFLVSGWLGAALDLTPKPIVIPEGMPEWLAFNYAQAIKAVQGNEPALEFIRHHKESPSLTLMLAELLIANKELDAGAEKLRQLSAVDSDVGVRAAWLLSLLYTERKQFDQARAVIAGQPRLAQDTLGLETLARISLIEGKTQEADQKYQQIQDKSWEAKSYLARKAFKDKDYAKAKTLTLELLQQFPSNVVLRQNYQRILEALGTENAAPQPTIPAVNTQKTVPLHE